MLPPGNRGHMPAAVLPLAVKLAALVADEIRGVDADVAYSALLTVAHRLKQEANHALVGCRARERDHGGRIG
jgi:hypothetical protein